MAQLNAPALSLGLDDEAIDAAVRSLGDGGLPLGVRHQALEAYRTLPAPGPALGRYWKIDVGTIDLENVAALEESPQPPQTVRREAGEAAQFLQTDFRVDGIDLDPALAAKGVVVCDFATALRAHPETVAATAGTAAKWQLHKFGALNAAFRQGGAFVFIPKGVSVEDPIVLRYRARATALFPYTLVVAAEGARATIVSHVEGGAFDGSLASEMVEVIVEGGAELTFAAVQRLDRRARSFSIKRGRLARNAKLHWALAELGAALSVGSVHSVVEDRGVETSISGVFFADGDQHIDLESEVDHRVGDAQSQTLFKSAATGHGQARYLGNIRIRPHAHGSDATLRDDALILSKTAHIDSIPALEIAANDVKAFHGATVGAISQDEVFYAMTRGIERSAAERMITLGFFEPALARFPGTDLRDSLREALAEKIG